MIEAGMDKQRSTALSIKIFKHQIDKDKASSSHNMKIQLFVK